MFQQFSQALAALRKQNSEMDVLLPAEEVQSVLGKDNSRAPLYTSLSVLHTFLRQSLHVDHACRQAVNGLLAHRAAAGLSLPSDDTGGYCKARQKLPEQAVWKLQRQTGRSAEDEAPGDWHWCSRRVRVVDGSTLKIQDTRKNRAEYPLMEGLVSGTSYPIVRILIVFSLAVGTVLEAAIAPYQGKGTGETGLLRSLASRLSPGDVLLGDRYFAGYWDIAWWQARQVDVVTRRPESRTSDFRCGHRLGPNDHLVAWPKTSRPDWLTRQEAAALPESLTLREVRVRVEVKGFRTKVVHVITTLLDPNAYPASELAELYRRRWQAELNLRSLKTHLGMEHLRTKTPEMVRKEFGMFLTAYNVVRRVQLASSERAVAVNERPRPPWELSVKGTVQLLNEFLPRVHLCQSPERWLEELLRLVARQQVGDRPNRIEPYATKLRPKDYPPLQTPRQIYKRQRQQ